MMLWKTVFPFIFLLAADKEASVVDYVQGVGNVIMWDVRPKRNVQDQ